MGFELGPCQILYGNVGASMNNLVDMGKTFGGVTLSIEESKQQLKSDQLGETPEDESITGRTVKITASLADISLNSFAAITNVSVSGSGNNAYVHVGSGAGTSLMTNAKKFVLKPYENGSPSNNALRYITLYKGGISSAVEAVYDSSTQRVLKFEVIGYPYNNANNAIVAFGNSNIA